MPATHPSDRRWTYRWIVAFAFWTLDALTTATNYHRMGQESGVSWEQALRTALASAWAWVPLTILALWLAERFPLDRGGWRRHLPVHLAGALGACLARAGLVLALNPWVGWYRSVPPLADLLLTSVANNLFLFALIVGVGHALVFARRSREKDEARARAELAALRMQIQPHFLFNALNTVAALVHESPSVAERMIVRLSTLLRATLDAPDAEEVPLVEELRIARLYLEIEEARFEDRLRVRWRVDPRAYGARVPHLILQPLVENAVRHGISPRAAPGTVEIAAERVDGTLRLEVRDDGVGGAPAAAAAGVGLQNTRERLRHLYGARQTVEVSGAPGGGFSVRITLPFRPGEDGA